MNSLSRPAGAPGCDLSRHKMSSAILGRPKDERDRRATLAAVNHLSEGSYSRIAGGRAAQSSEKSQEPGPAEREQPPYSGGSSSAHA